MKKVGQFSQTVIDLLNLSVIEGTPIFVGELNEKHMRNRHEYEFDKYFKDIPYILDNPDYVGINPNDNSIMYVREYEECGEFIRVGVKITNNGAYYARTLHLLSTCNTERYIEKGTLKRLTNMREQI